MTTLHDRFLTGSSTGSFQGQSQHRFPVPSPTGTGTGATGSSDRFPDPSTTTRKSTPVNDTQHPHDDPLEGEGRSGLVGRAWAGRTDLLAQLRRNAAVDGHDTRTA